MATYGLDEDAAFGYLRRVSSHTNTKVHDVAADLVRKTVEERRPST
jgi:AmiR/NasT family two-component response regulator